MILAFGGAALAYYFWSHPKAAKAKGTPGTAAGTAVNAKKVLAQTHAAAAAPNNINIKAGGGGGSGASGGISADVTSLIGKIAKSLGIGSDSKTSPSASNEPAAIAGLPGGSLDTNSGENAVQLYASPGGAPDAPTAVLQTPDNQGVDSSALFPDFQNDTSFDSFSFA